MSRRGRAISENERVVTLPEHAGQMEPEPMPSDFDREINGDQHHQQVGTKDEVVHQPVVVIDPHNLSVCPTSLDLTTARGRAMAFNATGQATLECDDNGSIVFQASDYMMHAVDMPNEETGEIGRVIRTVFITPNGDTFATFSDPVRDRLNQLLSLYGGARFDEPVTLQIVQRKSRRQKRIYQELRLVYTEPAPVQVQRVE